MNRNIQVSREDLIGYQVRMMMNQEKAAGYPLSVVEDAETAQLQYLFSEERLLKERLEGMQLSGRDYVAIIKDLAEQIINGKGFLLDEDRWLLEFDRILYDGSAYMLYLPVQGAERDMREAWQRFASRCLPYLDQEDPKILQANQRLHVFLENRNFDMTSFFRFVLNLEKSMGLVEQLNA